MKAERKGENFGKQKRIILLIVLLLVFIISALNMVSAAFYMKPDKIRMHLLYISMFFVIYLIFGNFCRVKLKATYRIFSERKINIIIFFTSILILLLMILGASLGVDFIPRINGAYGWIIIGGISIQPAEFLKIAFIINLANCLSKFENNDKVIEREIIISTALYLLLYAGLIILQRDMGTAIHYFFIWIVMMFYSKIRLFWIKIGVAIGSIFSLLAGIYIYGIVPNENTSYKIMRIKSYLTGLVTGEYSNDIGYQVKQSVYAFGSGGLLGKGYANGIQKYSYLPEIHTDFIMATLGEEFGLVGIFSVLLLFLIIYLIIDGTARDAKDSFGSFLATGIGILIITQVVINLFVAIGLFPVFGLPMPFFSYGGSSMLTMAIAFLIVGNIIAETYTEI